MVDILERFIVIEGMDGSGTTTQMKRITEEFDRSKIECHATYEPTSSQLGSLVRSVLRKEVVTTPLALAMLFSADREDHLFNPIYGIVEKMNKGTVVISDRYLFSSLAYQSIDCGFEKVSSLNEFPLPKFVVYLDTPISECLKRIDTRDNGRELFERQEFLEKVRDNYEFIFSDLPKDVVLIRIDGCKAIDHITDEIIQVLRTYSLL
ncbi:MAG: dTMP kinase [Sphaerochaetaceae bacterium]|jgi:dTMP kinase